MRPMEATRRRRWIYGLLLGVWALVVVWQVEEHARVVTNGRTSLRKDSRAIANTLGAFIRGLRFRGTVFPERLEPVLNELVQDSSNQVRSSSELTSIVLLNASGEPVAAAGKPFDPELKDILQEGERWGAQSVTMVYPIEGASLTPDGTTNGPVAVILAPAGPRGFPRRPPRNPPPGASNDLSNAAATPTNSVVTDTNLPEGAGAPPPEPGGRTAGPPPDFRPGSDSRPDRPEPPREGEARPRRPFWARGLDEKEYQELIQKRELHGLVLTLSTDAFREVARHDLWLRCVICFFAGISAIGVAVAWSNLSKSSELQLRLVRASELNTHLKEMNLAAAGLAHETRNPLNIIRGMAQMMSREAAAPTELREKSRAIVDETDKVTAQLNEFINYSRPREVRRSKLALTSAVNEIVRTLSHDLEEKQIRFEVKGESIEIEADEQLFRQALFNLVKTGAAEASLEVRDSGPGVPPEQRQEVFKPYFTTHQKGTGLGLAIVQQIVLVHGWEIRCLANEPKGAVFRITHLKVAV